MNWGYKILAVYMVFIAGILFLVFRSSGLNKDLVTTDYYAKELKYQQTIDEWDRTSALSAPVNCALKDGKIYISFPKDFTGKKLAGEAVLYCPSDEKKDLKQSFSVMDKPVIIPVEKRTKGLYELHLNWNYGQATYYFEKKIFI